MSQSELTWGTQYFVRKRRGRLDKMQAAVLHVSAADNR